jgi:hypothetical protein
MITRDPVAAPKTGPRRAAGSGPNGSKGLDAGQPNRLTVRTIVASVMPAQPGIHDLPLLRQRNSWIPAFAGMTL